MGMHRAQLLQGIIYRMTHLRVIVEQSNQLNLQDINVHAENFFRDLLNLAFDYDLQNINIVEPNATAIDLGCDSSRIAIQVTSTPDLSKIKHTFDRFTGKRLQTKYDRLVMLIVGQKKKYRETGLGDDRFKLSFGDDVWDIADLLKKIGDLSTAKMEACHDFLSRELLVREPKLSNEVGTLVRLIEVLSSAEEGLSSGDNREDPDPDGKIHDRFADHAPFLTQQYVDLHELYGRVLSEVNAHTDLGHIRVRKLQIYLMNWSDRVLTECGGDPQAALELLTQRVLGMMGSSDAGFDDGAVRYYLIDQLIMCNVFPNKRSQSA